MEHGSTGTSVWEVKVEEHTGGGTLAAGAGFRISAEVEMEMLSKWAGRLCKGNNHVSLDC